MMPEALTESFCERCGTRYEFAAPTQLNTMRKTRGLISGLKNYIMSQDALGDAVGDAMRSEEEALAAQQLDAFHESFNFCINCRQYTCLNCWNDDAGRCRTCVPIAGTDDLLERFEASFQAQHPEMAASAATAEMDQADVNRRLGLEAWPSEDLAEAPAGEIEPVLADSELEPASEPMVAETEADAPLEPIAAQADMAAFLDAPQAEEYPPLRVLAWEEDAEIALEPEPEPTVAEVAPEPEPEPVVAEVAPEPEPEPAVADVAPEPEPEPVVAEEDQLPTEVDPEVLAAMVARVDPEPVVAEVEPEPEPVVAEVAPEPEPEPEPVVAEVAPEPEPEPVPPAPRPIRPISETILTVPPVEVPAQEPDADRVAAQADEPSLAARKAQLDMLGIGDPGQGTLGPDRSNVLPYRSSGASVSAREAAMRTASGLPAPGAFWEASAREVAGAMSTVGVQACGECGLSLSASARFCRRCGTRQARSA
jgi:ribosomal protein L40E